MLAESSLLRRPNTRAESFRDPAVNGGVPGREVWTKGGSVTFYLLVVANSLRALSGSTY
jgi:hypothetical protein